MPSWHPCLLNNKKEIPALLRRTSRRLRTGVVLIVVSRVVKGVAIVVAKRSRVTFIEIPERIL
jgi:hypothetical protein